MTDQPTLIPAEVLAASACPPPRREDWYIIIGQWRGTWLIPTNVQYRWHLTDKHAAKQCDELRRNGWSDLRIVRIPGEGSNHAEADR